MAALPERRDAKHGFRLSQDFWLWEGRCRCADRGFPIHDGFCGGAVIWMPQLLDLLQAIRNEKGFTRIESLYRCWRYHSELYREIGADPPKTSAHLTGEAADVWTQVPLVYPADLNLLVSNGCKGIGYYSKHPRIDGLITHVDTKGTRLRTWDYSSQ